MTNRQITIVISDDHPLFRKGLIAAIQGDETLKILAEAGDGERGMDLVEQHHPDVAIFDIDMPKMTGIEATRALQKKKSDASIIILTMHAEQVMFDKAMDAGAIGYVLKESAVNDIVECIKSVATGIPFISPTLSRHLLKKNRSFTQGTEKKLGLADLTQAERKILGMIAQGKSTNQIADELFISPKTVGHHRSHICEKVGISGTNALLKFALENKELL